MTCFGFWDVAALSRYTRRRSRTFRWRIGKSALILGTLRRTFAGFAMLDLRANTRGLLEAFLSEFLGKNEIHDAFRHLDRKDRDGLRRRRGPGPARAGTRGGGVGGAGHRA